MTQFIADADFGLANFIGEAKFHESKFTRKGYLW